MKYEKGSGCAALVSEKLPNINFSTASLGFMLECIGRGIHAVNLLRVKTTVSSGQITSDYY